MPRGDRTGPMGTSPMSGRRAGYCAGNNAPGFANPTVPRLGLRRGFTGGGHGWRKMFCVTPQQETDALKARADWLKQQLDAINKRLEELQAK